ncbi:MAG TPA: helix-turn-helix domain-containing protein [Streptosporangiaceae bacterium]|nr:helix-turn-helix domain-containing protein [Streptosporangiaceae bacterium]
MTRRDYGQYCGLARALELVGERWTLLIMRELLARPSRYTDLLDDLPGIPTNVLSTRLKELEEAGIVERRIAPAPQRGILYAPTEAGQNLQGAVIALALWGNAHLGEQEPNEFVPPSSVVMALRATFNPGAAHGLTATWEIHTGDAVMYAAVADGQLATGVGPAPGEPDLVITVPSDEVLTYRAMMQAISNGAAELTGQQSLLEKFARVFTPRAATKAG